MHATSVINPCENDPCLNGGTCVGLNGNATCVCPVHASGLICQTLSESVWFTIECRALLCFLLLLYELFAHNTTSFLDTLFKILWIFCFFSICENKVFLFPKCYITCNFHTFYENINKIHNKNTKKQIFNWCMVHVGFVLFWGFIWLMYGTCGVCIVLGFLLYF